LLVPLVLPQLPLLRSLLLAQRMFMLRLLLPRGVIALLALMVVALALHLLHLVVAASAFLLHLLHLLHLLRLLHLSDLLAALLFLLRALDLTLLFMQRPLLHLCPAVIFLCALLQ